MDEVNPAALCRNGDDDRTTASCACCTGWVKHLSGAGFAVQDTTTEDTAAMRKKTGIPDAFGACHSATIEGYAIEGHVSAAEIRRLLALKPPAIR